MDWLTWPLVGLILGGGALLGFGRPIAHAIKTHGLNAKGWGTHPAGLPNQSALIDGGERGLDAIETFRELSVAETPLQRTVEQSIRETLEERQAADPRTAYPILVSNLASTILAFACEQRFGQIFKSQLRALEHLNQRRGSGEEVGALRQLHFEPDFAGAEEETFTAWMAWLEGREFITVEDDHVLITEVGAYFLTYVAQQGLSTSNKVL